MTRGQRNGNECLIGKGIVFGFISAATTKDRFKRNLVERGFAFSSQFQFVVHPIREVKAMGTKSS